MLYVCKLKITPGDDPITPAVSSLKLTVGVLKRVIIMFPAGCEGDVGVRIKHSEHILYPSNNDEWIIDDDRTLDWIEDYEIPYNETEFKVEGYNTDPIFDHSVYFRFNVLEKSLFYLPSSTDISIIAAEMM